MANEKPDATATKPVDNKALAAELLKKHQEREAKRAAKKLEAAARKEAADKLKEARRLAEQPLITKEEKAANFERLANQRVSKAVKAIQAVRYLSNRGQYHYEPEHVGKILARLAKEIDALEAAFSGASASGSEFKL